MELPENQKNRMQKKKNQETIPPQGNEQEISRRQALQKMGYAAFASSTMFLLLNNPTKVFASSTTEDNPGDPGFPTDNGGEKSNSFDDDPWA